MKYASLLIVLALTSCVSTPKSSEHDDSKYQSAIARMVKQNAIEDAEADARMARILGFHDQVTCDTACMRIPYWTLPGNLPVVAAPDMAPTPFHDTTIGK